MINFRSDNEAPVASEIMEAITIANCGTAYSYGGDSITGDVSAKFSELFENHPHKMGEKSERPY